LIDIAWDTAVPTPNNPSTASRHQKFLQIIHDYAFFQHVKAFARPISGKVLDLLLSTYPNAISDASNVSALSDHLAVISEVNLKPTRSVKPPHNVYLYNKANFDGLREFMSDSSSAFFASKPEERSFEENWNMFKTSLIAGMCQFIPQKLSRSKFKLPWIDISLKREMHKKDRLHKKAIHSKNNQHWEAFKHQRNFVSKLIKEAHNHYLHDVIGNSLTNNPKNFWSYVKEQQIREPWYPSTKEQRFISMCN